MDVTSVEGGRQDQPRSKEPAKARESAGVLYPCIDSLYCNKPKGPPEKPETLFCPSRCRSHFCAECCVGLGVELREELRPVVEKWPAMAMLTLTVDPKGFESPLDAWLYVGKKRGISVLMQHLKRKKQLMGPEWLSVLEMHESGWPHWHCLVAAEFIGVQHIHDGWKLGRIHVAAGRKFKNRAHGLHYATKYVIKQDRPLPPCMLASPHRIRKYSTSRGLLGRSRVRSEGAETEDEKRKRTTVQERMERCGKELRKFNYVVEEDRYAFAGTLKTDNPEALTEYVKRETEAERLKKEFEAWLKSV